MWEISCASYFQFFFNGSTTNLLSSMSMIHRLIFSSYPGSCAWRSIGNSTLFLVLSFPQENNSTLTPTRREQGLRSVRLSCVCLYVTWTLINSISFWCSNSPSNPKSRTEGLVQGQLHHVYSHSPTCVNCKRHHQLYWASNGSKKRKRDNLFLTDSEAGGLDSDDKFPSPSKIADTHVKKKCRTTTTRCMYYSNCFSIMALLTSHQISILSSNDKVRCWYH
jgi:hypothetical protein